LNGKVDAYTSHRGHGVRGIADAEQAGPGPFAEAVDLHGEEFDLLPILHLVDARLEIGCQLENAGAKGLETTLLDFVECALANDQTGLSSHLMR